MSSCQCTSRVTVGKSMILKCSHSIQRSGMQQPAPSPNLHPYSLASRPWPSRRPYGRVATIRGMNADDRTSSYWQLCIMIQCRSRMFQKLISDVHMIKRPFGELWPLTLCCQSAGLGSAVTRLFRHRCCNTGWLACVESWVWTWIMGMDYGHGLWAWYNTRRIRHYEYTSMLVIRQGLLHRTCCTASFDHSRRT